MSVPDEVSQFLLDGQASAAEIRAAVAAAADAHGVSWAADGQARSLRRTWLDTFDWRLYRAGLTLEQVSRKGAAELVLTGRDGGLIATERVPAGALPGWPALAATLPPGPVREAVEPAAGIRALAPVARVTSTVTGLRALNDDAKTVARLALDRMAVTLPLTVSGPARLTLSPVRGYGGITDRVSRAIGTLPGIHRARGSALDAALAASGQLPGQLPGKARAVPLSPAMPAATALAAILSALLDAIEINVPGTVRDVDTEFLHDLRIAVRWSRSALKLCGSALPGDLAARYAPEFRWLGDLTTPTRDLDVYLLGLGDMAAGLVAATAADLDPFRAHLEQSRAREYRRLAAGLRSARFARLVASWRAELDSVRPARKRRSVAVLATERITAAQRKAVRTGSVITASSPPQALHDLRKRCKELRYLVEMFGSLHDAREHWQAVRELKALQNCLGAFQDAEVERSEIGMFAVQMHADRQVPAATLLAMGEIAAGLARRQQAARGEFAGRFADFASEASQDRLTRLARTGLA